MCIRNLYSSATTLNSTANRLSWPVEFLFSPSLRRMHTTIVNLLAMMSSTKPSNSTALTSSSRTIKSKDPLIVFSSTWHASSRSASSRCLGTQTRLERLVSLLRSSLTRKPSKSPPQPFSWTSLVWWSIATMRPKSVSVPNIWRSAWMSVQSAYLSTCTDLQKAKWTASSGWAWAKSPSSARSLSTNNTQTDHERMT